MSTRPYAFRGQVLPDDIRHSLDLYAEHGVPPGDFLRAVLQNDLLEAVGRADQNNLAALGAIVGYCYNELPHRCYGNPKAVRQHLDRFQAARQVDTES